MEKYDSQQLMTAIEYVKRMANGNNPVNNSPLPDNDVLNNPNIILSQIPDKKIAVNIPEDVLANMIITTGPRFDNVIPSNEFSGVAGVRKSVFAGKLNYIYCDVCNTAQNGKSI